MAYMLYFRALHIIFIVTWFAGLFYIVRLFIYAREAQDKESPERETLTAQFAIMKRRLWYGITWPSAILALVFGLGILHPWLPNLPTWLVTKLSLVGSLYVYMFLCHRIFRQQNRGKYNWSSQQLRVFNEVATVFLVGIVFLVTLKNTLDMLYGLLGLVIFSALLMLAIVAYRKARSK